MSSYPPREKNCSLEFVKVDMQELSSSTGTWEVIGQIVLQEEGKQDPFDEKYKAIVRPRACSMGGEAVSILMNATSEGLVSSGTTISYGILRKRDAKSEASKKF